MNEVEIKGTYQQGKMYRGGGRWAKVMVSRFHTRPSMISIAFGREDELSAFKSARFELQSGYRKSLDESAREYIRTGEIHI